ncbi:hypothetical protein SPRG_03894 [Saprolegnia parasitica CBS 223.65]|uniref:Leucine-rich repeat-containing N-terminal plant-type domain-containing protein n=1 Tax=Saprolegnia parasitica (strain CBS 223.65) TaxID=695850 RepID=A0A067CKP3_SAPPC|nr:hypothetical protein SPRG_03894 [Saprolegnia parasitica CBS 223.65]KDO31279.1 hypothetical protein SPRG_03894 [Saprolegnia parasitica CBS 223.65]|eukprot:XP_012197878.1 hypothetical protein SPRG_03894 [Saprolegnia parasitica CBS 223.65]
MRLREPSTWRNIALVLGLLLATAAADGCSVAKTTLTARCGFVVSSPDNKRVCAYDPSSCKPIIKTDTCAGSDGNQYGNFTNYLWLCSYSTSQCQDVSNSVSDTFNKVYSDNQETYKNAVFFNNAKSIQETGLFCYDASSKQELGAVVIASSRHCIYDTSCNVAPWTDATKAVDIVNDYYTVNSSMVLSGLGITALGPDLASDFNKNNTYTNLDLTKNQLTDLASTKFPSSLMVMDVSQNNLTSIAKIQATNLNALRASSNAITSIGELPSGLWSLYATLVVFKTASHA